MDATPDTMEQQDGAARLFGAVAAGDVETMRALLVRSPELVRARRKGEGGRWTALHLTAEQGRAGAARILLEHGADVMARDEGDHATPLHWAAQGGHLEVARLLLQHGADVNASDDLHERGPLGWAVALSVYHPEMAELLIDHGAEVDVFAAVALNSGERVRALVAADPEVLRSRMSVFEGFRSPLHFAVVRDRLEMLELLLDLGAEVDAVTPSGRSALCLAAETGREELRDRLLARGAAVDLLAAITLGREARALELLEGDVTPEELGRALVLAARRGCDALASRLLARGAPVEATGPCDWMRGATALIGATCCGHAEVARLLVERGADVRAKDEYPGATALHYAAWNGSQEVAALLLEHGAELQVKDDMYGARPMGWAVENRQSAMVDWLLSRGSTISINEAAYLGRADLVRACLDADPSGVNTASDYGAPLHQAASHGHVEVARLLLERGADAALPNSHGKTPLELVQTKLAGELSEEERQRYAGVEALLTGGTAEG